MFRVGSRTVGVAGLMGGFVLPVASQVEHPPSYVDAVLGLTGGVRYTLADAPLAAGLALAAVVAFGVLFVRSRGQETWAVTTGEAWLLLGAGVSGFLAFPIAAVTASPNPSEAYPGLGAISLALGGSILFMSAAREFRARLRIRYRDFFATGVFVFNMLLFALPWGRLQDRSTDFSGTLFDALGGVSDGRPDQYTTISGFDMAVYGIELIYVVGGVFVVFVGLLALRYRWDRTTLPVQEYAVSTDWAVVVLFAVLSYLFEQARPTGSVLPSDVEQLAAGGLAQSLPSLLATGFLVLAMKDLWDTQQGAERPTE